jgi:hypothetical protein
MGPRQGAVVLKPVPMTQGEIADFLDTMAAAVRAGDSFEGFIEYLLPDPPELGGEPVPDDTYAMVKASVRFGNSLGQGGVTLIGEVVNDPPEQLTEAEILAEVLEMSERAIVVLLPEKTRKRDYDALYEAIERLAKERDEDTAMVGVWPVGGHDG